MNSLNKVEIRFFGLRRSGNHGVISWILSLFEPGRLHFINDISPHSFEASDATSDFIRGVSPDCLVQLHDPKSLLIYSFEDIDLSKHGDWWIPPALSGDSAEKVTILLLRDPYNMLSSRLQILRNLPNNSFAQQMLLPDENNTPHVAYRWIQYAREFSQRTALLGEGNIIYLNYNKWIFDRSYRKEICQNLGGTYTEGTLDVIPKQGFGSSFEGWRGKHLKDRNGLLHRWLHFQGDPLFEELVNNPELSELSNEIFGSIRV